MAGYLELLDLPAEVLIKILMYFFLFTNIKVNHAHFTSLNDKRRVNDEQYRCVPQKWLTPMLTCKVLKIHGMKAFMQQALFHYKGQERTTFQDLYFTTSVASQVRCVSADFDTLIQISKCINNKYGFKSLKQFIVKDSVHGNLVDGRAVRKARAVLKARQIELTGFVAIVGPPLTRHFPIHPPILQTYIVNRSHRRWQKLKLIFEVDGNVIITDMENMGNDFFRNIKAVFDAFTAGVHKPRGYAFDGLDKYMNEDAPEWQK
ncbi:hypothetical protein LTR05_007493 [Lithohypha guttulata]|uniref:Uncharacterized protein n=1 Tax=Lithohypha guttulata TaxID=1690604 RepID=A0AAN7SW63_9EURO|nr:hypothetical protein LTR05_007493 [Lithohypha guttulata]